MNKPLALLLSSRGLIATQLEQRLESLRYRMAALAAPDELVARAEAEKPMVVFADLEGAEEPVSLAVEQLRARAATAHLPVIGFRCEMDDAAQVSLIERGFTITVNEAAILSHLPQLLDRALDIT